MIFKGIRTSIAKKPYILVIFQGGGVRTPCPPPSGPAHALRIRMLAALGFRRLLWGLFFIKKMISVVYILVRIHGTIHQN